MTLPSAHVLVVEDEEHLALGLKFNLEAEGFRASVAGTGENALALLSDETERIDIVILDAMLPGQDGFSVVRALRARQDFTPVLMLTARSRPEDVLLGFAAGADDYLPKPFDLSILLARVHGLLRRIHWQRSTEPAAPGATKDAPADEPDPFAQKSFTFANRTLDFDALELRTPARTVRLTLMEANLLRYLVQNGGRIISRKELLEQVWRMHEDTDTRAIDNFIVRLRRHIEDDPSRPVYLETIRGVGYRFLRSA